MVEASESVALEMSAVETLLAWMAFFLLRNFLRFYIGHRRKSGLLSQSYSRSRELSFFDFWAWKPPPLRLGITPTDRSIGNHNVTLNRQNEAKSEKSVERAVEKNLITILLSASHHSFTLIDWSNSVA